MGINRWIPPSSDKDGLGERREGMVIVKDKKEKVDDFVTSVTALSKHRFFHIFGLPKKMHTISTRVVQSLLILETVIGSLEKKNNVIFYRYMSS